MLKNMGDASIVHYDALWYWNTFEKETPTLHTWLSPKSSSVGEIAERLAASSRHEKEYPSLKEVSVLACMKKNKDVEKKRDKKGEKDKIK